MKRAVEAVTLVAIAMWVGCLTSAQAAIWTESGSQWAAEAVVWGVSAFALSALAAVGWGLLPPPGDD